MRAAVLDASAYLFHWRVGIRPDVLRRLRRAFRVRQSSLVLAELRRQARSVEARRLVDQLHRSAPDAWAPTPADWWNAGGLVQQLGDLRQWTRDERATFQSDALLALTARRHRAVIVTTRRDIFGLLRSAVGIDVLYLG